MSGESERKAADPQENPAVKVCGITNLEDARFAAGAGADYLGFIFYRKSPRYIEPPKAGAIINWIHGPTATGVFVNQSPEDVNHIVRQTGVDLVQLHGTESPEYCRLIEKPVIKVFHVGSQTTDDLEEQIRPYLECVDYIMFDTSAGDLWGGTGKVFDWNLLRNLSRVKPIFLSGGLNVENIGRAYNTVRPYAVDLNSGLEQAPGIKDFDKIELFFQEMDRIHSRKEEES